VPTPCTQALLAVARHLVVASRKCLKTINEWELLAIVTNGAKSLFLRVLVASNQQVGGSSPSGRAR